MTRTDTRCSLLLRLPTKELEDAFWRAPNTLKAYATWDVYISFNTLVINTLMIKLLWRLLFTPSVLHLTWHIHTFFLVSFTTCPAIIALAWHRPTLYSRHRHKIIAATRLLRLACMAGAALNSSSELQAVVAAAVRPPPRGDDSRALLYAAIMTASKPLFLSPLTAMAQGSWVLPARYWVPLQLLTFILAFFGTARHVPCRLASDAASGLLLQPACVGMTQLHTTLAGSMFGAAFTNTLLPSGATDDPPACADANSSARTLVWYTQAAYAFLLPLTGFFALEWRLKVLFMRSRMRKHLAYGPWGWPRGRDARGTKSRLQQGVAWVVVTAASLWLLWLVALVVVPWLPAEPCVSCVDAGTCTPLPACEGLMCESPGLWLAALVYAEMLFVLVGHLIVTGFVM